MRPIGPDAARLATAAVIVALTAPATAQIISGTPHADWLSRLVSVGTDNKQAIREYQQLYPRLYASGPAPEGARLEAYQHMLFLRGTLGEDAPQWSPMALQTYSGRMNAIVRDPWRPEIRYAAAAGGGIWRSTDSGHNWLPLTDHLPALCTDALLVDTRRPSLLRAGVGAGQKEHCGGYRAHVLESSDEGRTWDATLVDRDARFFYELVADPFDPGRLWAATDSGLFRVEGKNSTRVATTLPAAATSVLPSKLSAGVILAGFWQQQNPPPGQSSDPSGLFRSVDGGATWARVTLPHSPKRLARIALAQSAADRCRMYAAVTHLQEDNGNYFAAMYRSEDEGATWLRLPDLRRELHDLCGSYCWYTLSLAVDPDNVDNVYLGGVKLYRSTDGGENWTQWKYPDLHADVHDIRVEDDGVWAATDGGISVSDANATIGDWKARDGNLVTGQYAHLTTHPARAIVVAGAQDRGVLRLSPQANEQLRPGDGGFTGYDDVQDVFYAAEYSFSGVHQYPNAGLIVSIPVAASACLEAHSRLWPFHLVPADGPPIVLGASCILRYEFGDGKFLPLSNPLTMLHDMISDVDVRQPGLAWAGSFTGYVWRSRLGEHQAGGSFWEESKPRSPGNRSITSIAAHPTDADVAYVSVGGHGKAHVWRTTDGARSWEPLGDTGPSRLPEIEVNQILVLSAKPLVLLVATDLQAYRSDDGGASWYVLGSGLPNVSVSWLSYASESQVLRAATYGRGIWELPLATKAGQGPPY